MKKHEIYHWWTVQIEEIRTIDLRLPTPSEEVLFERANEAEALRHNEWQMVNGCRISAIKAKLV